MCTIVNTLLEGVQDSEEYITTFGTNDNKFSLLYTILYDFLTCYYLFDVSFNLVTTVCQFIYH